MNYRLTIVQYYLICIVLSKFVKIHEQVRLKQITV